MLCRIVSCSRINLQNLQIELGIGPASSRSLLMMLKARSSSLSVMSILSSTSRPSHPFQMRLCPDLSLFGLLGRMLSRALEQIAVDQITSDRTLSLPWQFQLQKLYSKVQEAIYSTRHAKQERYIQNLQ